MPTMDVYYSLTHSFDHMKEKKIADSLKMCVDPLSKLSYACQIVQ